MEKETMRQQMLNLEDKLTDYELVMSNLKQQNVGYQCAIKSKEENMIHVEKQFEDCRMKLKQSNEEIMRLDDQIKAYSNEISNLQNIKEDLENKVAMRLFFYSVFF